MDLVRTVSSARLDHLVTEAQRCARRRTNLNLHLRLDDPIQRMFNAVEPGTYVRPHRHLDPPRWEVFLALRGRALVVLFSDQGEVSARCSLAPSGPDLAVEIAGGAWHSVAALDAGTLLFELKPGPYVPLDDKDFAARAPAEGGTGCAPFLSWLVTARPGERPPGP